MKSTQTSAIKREQFQQLVRRFEAMAARNPRAYRLRVGLLALLGYGVLTGSVLLLGLLFLAIVILMVTGHSSNYLAVRLLIFLGGLEALLLQSLWVKIERPEGLVLSRAEAPALFGLVEEIVRKLKCAPVDYIVVDQNFNAGMASVPRLGIFGFAKNYLVVGLPLMQALSPDRFRSVIAHELGHISRRHDRFGHWIYRVGKSWFQLLESLKKSRHRGAGTFRAFFQWYAPYFFASSFVLDRAVEYEADRSAAELTGARNAADALLEMAIQEVLLRERFWPELYHEAVQQPQPPSVFGLRLPEALRHGPPEEEARKWLENALEEQTDLNDTHPSLSKRLKALAEEPRLPPPSLESAADQFLGSGMAAIASNLDFAWVQRVGHAWKEQYSRAVEERQRLQDLDERAARGPLEVGEAFTRARYTEKYRSAEAAIPLYRDILADAPEHTGALFSMGGALLSQGDRNGIPSIEAAAALDPRCAVTGWELIFSFLSKQGQSKEAEPYRRRILANQRAQAEARAERARITESDPLIPHGLPEPAVQRLRSQLAAIRRVGHAYLVRKKVRYTPEEPFYLLAVAERFSWNSGGPQSKKQLLRLLQQEVALPGQSYLAVLPMGRLEKKLKKIAGARIYR